MAGNAYYEVSYVTREWISVPAEFDNIKHSKTFFNKPEAMAFYKQRRKDKNASDFHIVRRTDGAILETIL